MAFIPSAPHNLSAPHTRQFATSSRVSRSHVRPRLASRRAQVRMMANGDEPDEVAVPLTSLKDLNASPAASPSADPMQEGEDDERSEEQKEMDRLRAAEKFITLDEGSFECTACSYLFEPKKGVRQAGILPDTAFEDLPPAFVCPVCRSPKSRFMSKKKIIAGFADNQTYGFGSNTMTGGQKSALIYGGLVVSFLLLLSGYALN